MATLTLGVFLRRLTRAAAAESLGGQSDRQLVEQLRARRDETAFEALVRRHGPMVYRVCWRVLQQEQDAEDAFQATFLVLGQKVRTLRSHNSLAAWLHSVAHRMALKAKARAAARRCHEHAASASRAVPPDELTWLELRTVLDAELARLPEKWRLPLILCYLETRTQDEAAKQLGWSKNTLRRRLDEARAALGRRLARRGVGLAALSAVLLSDGLASAALPQLLVGSTVEAATLVAAGDAAAPVVSARVAALTQEALRIMFITKLKAATAALVIAGLFISGLLVAALSAAPQPAPAQQPVPEGKDKSADRGAPAKTPDRLKMRMTFEGHGTLKAGRAPEWTGQPHGFALSADEKLVALGYATKKNGKYAGKVDVRDTESGELVATLALDTVVDNVAFSSRGGMLAAGCLKDVHEESNNRAVWLQGEEGVVRIWDVQDPNK
jgi:RNA polymerase sigma factor (sigma-70 family)